MAEGQAGPAPAGWSYQETSWLAEGHRKPIYCGAFNHLSPHLGDLLATVGGNRATVYQCRPGGEMAALQVYVDADTEEEYFVCAWSLDVATGAPLLLLAGKNGVLLAVNPLTGSLHACFEGHGSCINDIAVHPNRPQFAATASKDQSLRLWNLHTRCCVLVFQGDGGHRNEVLTLSWNPGDDCLLLSAGMDNHIKIWSLAEHEHTLAASDDWRPGHSSFPAGHVTMPVFSTERVHWNYVDCVRWLGDHVLSKSVDNTIVVWRPDRSTKRHAREGDVELQQELQLEDCAKVWWLRFALDYWCSVLAVGTNTGRVLLYDPHAQQPSPKARLRPQRFNGKGGQKPLVRQTAVSYDGSIIVACHDGGELTRFDRVAAPAGGSGGSSAGVGGSGGGGAEGGGWGSSEEEEEEEEESDEDTESGSE